MIRALSNVVPNRLSFSVALLGLILVSFCCVDVDGAVPPRRRIPAGRQNELEPITLDDILNGTLSARGFNGQWVQGSDHLIRIFKPQAVVNYNILDGKDEIVLNIADIINKLPNGSQFSNLIFSNDGKYALVEHGRSSLWRYSSLAKYDIYDIENREMVGKLVPPGDSQEQQTLQLVQWSPTGNGIAFVHKYNIYYRPDANANTPVRQLTFDGEDEEKAIYNGIADWVYEEEMLGGPTALWISKTGKNLAFIKFNDSQVMEFQWPIYGEPGSNQTIYPEYRKIRYPKAGTPNPEAHMYVMSLDDANSSPQKVEYPQTDIQDLHLIGTAVWASDEELMVATLNREQTVSQWHICTVNPAHCDKVYTYRLDHGWVDMNTPKVSSDGTKFIFLQSQKQTKDGDSYNHIVMFMKIGTSKVITKGRFSVGSILGWDEPRNRIYFSGTFWNGSMADPSETQVYWIADNGEDSSALHCITCGLLNSAGGLCRDNSVVFSENFTHFIHRCSGPDVPETTTRLTEGGYSVAFPGPTYVNNSEVREKLKKKAVPITKEYQIPVGPGNKFVARARLYLPENYDENKKYPLLISVYGGPGSQNLKQTYGLTWEMSLVSDKGIIFGQIDGRGTGRQSSEHLFELHRKLGTAEIEDQITATKWLAENLSFIDANNTAIWGWSYGGYATARVLETDTGNVFKCGISVAPVTNWRYYDTIYTERYMGLPTLEDNLLAYESSDATSKQAIQNLRKKQYMIVHGNADDNVHYQQSMILARALEQNDIFFHQLSYPDENHGIAGPGMRRHLYHSLQYFLFKECYTATSEIPVPTTPAPGTTTPGAGGNTTAGAPALTNSFASLVSVSILMLFRYLN